MTDIDRLVNITERNRRNDSISTERTKVEQTENKRDETSVKLREVVFTTFAKAAGGILGSTPHGKQALQMLTPFFSIAVLGKGLYEGLMSNAEKNADLNKLNAKIAKLEAEKSHEAANSPNAPAALSPGLRVV